MYDDEFAIIGLIFASILLACLILVGVFYCLTIQRTLEFVSPENRKMPSANVWLLFIPIFNFVWHFIVVNNVADSLKAEFEKRGIKCFEQRPGHGIGLAASICWCTVWIPGINIITGLGALVCWIIYWAKISNYKNQLGFSGNSMNTSSNPNRQTDILDNPNF